MAGKKRIGIATKGVKSRLTMQQMNAWLASKPKKCLLGIKCVNCEHKKKHSANPLCQAGVYKFKEPTNLMPNIRNSNRHSLCLYCIRPSLSYDEKCHYTFDDPDKPFQKGVKGKWKTYSDGIKYPMVLRCNKYIASNTDTAKRMKQDSERKIAEIMQKTMLNGGI